MTPAARTLAQAPRAIAIGGDARAGAGRDPDAIRVVGRGVARAGAPVTGADGDRMRLSGSHDQIREDTAWLADQGVTEVFYDLNWDPQVGAPDVPSDAATDRAMGLIAALAPTP